MTSRKRRADWGKIYEEKRAALEKELKTKWDEKPISMTRIYAEITEALKGEDWVLTNGSSQGKENLYLPASQVQSDSRKIQRRRLGLWHACFARRRAGAQRLRQILRQYPARRLICCLP